MKYFYKYLLVFSWLTFFMIRANAQCVIDPTRPHPQEGDWYYCPPGSTQTPGLGFPGNPNPYPLQEVVIRPSPDDYSGFPPFPILPNTAGLPPGWSVFVPKANQTIKIPCPGDPVRSPHIAPSGKNNVKGGRFGYTRSGGTQFHDGTDIAATPGSNLYSMYSGVVTDIRNTFQPDEYAEKSYGNYVEIKSVINGDIVYLKYNHLNGVGTNVTVGAQITQGQQIGITGSTGNAASSEVYNKHVHIQAKDANQQPIDPEPYISTKFDQTTGQGTSPCN